MSLFRRASATRSCRPATCWARATSPPKHAELLYGRACRALGNYLENFTPFVAVALALIATQRTGGAGAVGATIWILARIVYLPIYVFGIIYVRTMVWGISIIGLVMMLGRLIGW